MKKLTIIFLLFSLAVKGQSSNDSTAISNIENASYLNGDLTKILKKLTRYPVEEASKGVKGDVVISFNIMADGKIDSLIIESSPSKRLSANSLVSFDQLKGKWNPYKVNGTPINKKYLLVFRYRYYLDTSPPEYKKKAAQFISKEKYDKALKVLNKAIKDNKYDYTLFELRSKVKEKLGDIKGSKTDFEKALHLKSEIISLVKVDMIGKMRRALKYKTETRTIRN